MPIPGNMDEPPRCPECARALPCECGVGSRAGFALLPPLSAEDEGGDLLEEELRFTRLLREVKRDVCQRPFLQEEGARDLAKAARQMEKKFDSSLDPKDLERADRLAEKMLGDVLHFPRRREGSRWRRGERIPWLLLLSIVLGAMLAMALLYSRPR